MKQLTKKEAIALAKGGEWKDWTYRDKAKFQLYQRRLCMPFSVFHEAMEKVLERPVFTHEFAFPALTREFEGKNGKPTFKEILELIPKEKRLVIPFPFSEKEREHYDRSRNQNPLKGNIMTINEFIEKLFPIIKEALLKEIWSADTINDEDVLEIIEDFTVENLFDSKSKTDLNLLIGDFEGK